MDHELRKQGAGNVPLPASAHYSHSKPRAPPRPSSQSQKPGLDRPGLLPASSALAARAASRIEGYALGIGLLTDGPLGATKLSADGASRRLCARQRLEFANVLLRPFTSLNRFLRHSDLRFPSWRTEHFIHFFAAINEFKQIRIGISSARGGRICPAAGSNLLFATST